MIPPLHRLHWLTILGLLTLAGCNRSTPSPSIAASKPAESSEGLAELAAETFRKSGDLAAYRRLTDQLNVALGRANAERKPEPLTDQQRALLKDELALNDAELAEVARHEYTPLDAYYLDETLRFRDIARALDVAHAQPVDRARAALDWIVVNLRTVETNQPANPPWFVAMRGAGSTLERTYALLALLHQLDLDACLIGDESAAGGTSGFWAVGVLAGSEIYVLDVRLGLPLPAPGENGVATLAQVRGDARVVESLAVDPKLPYDVTQDRAKKAVIYLSAPLSAVSPRMRFLQGLLPANTARLDVDLVAVRDRYQKVAQSQPYQGCSVRLWNAPAADALPRALMSFLPATEGGTDRRPPAERRMARFYLDAVPWRMLPPFFLDLQGEGGERVRALFADRITMLSQPGKARDLILRGQYDEATKQLVELQADLNKRPFTIGTLEEPAKIWAEQARTVYANLARSERAAIKDPNALADVDAQKKLVDILWQKHQALSLYLAYIVTEPLMAESTYLLAVCKHEEAQQQANHGDVNRAAWHTAQMWWSKYVSSHGTSVVGAAARRHYARALSGAGRAADAMATYQALTTSDLTPLEKLACAFLASGIK